MRLVGAYLIGLFSWVILGLVRPPGEVIFLAPLPIGTAAAFVAREWLGLPAVLLGIVSIVLFVFVVQQSPTGENWEFYQVVIALLTCVGYGAGSVVRRRLPVTPQALRRD